MTHKRTADVGERDGVFYDEAFAPTDWRALREALKRSGNGNAMYSIDATNAIYKAIDSRIELERERVAKAIKP